MVKIKKVGMLGVLFLMILGLVGSAYAITPETHVVPVAHVSDADKNVQNEFLPTEDVYGFGRFEEVDYTCAAVDEACSGFVDLYIVNESLDWWAGDGTEALIETGDGVETVGVSGTCIDAPKGLECFVDMPVTKVWSAVTTHGSYDFIIDVDQDAFLDQFDPIDDAIITGFTVLPEFTTIGAALVLLGSGLYARYKRRRV